MLFLFILIALLAGIFFKNLQRWLPIEYTPIILILGIILGFLFEELHFFGDSIEYVSRIDGHSLLMIFIPPLIFESSFNCDTHVFMKSIWQILILAFPAVAVSIILISLVLRYVLGYHEQMNWGMALSLGSILAATDPVAVVAILKSTGAKIKLNMLIEGESLLNDGSASIFFFVFVDMILTPGFSFGNFIVKFARLTLGGLALGLGAGVILYPIIFRLHNDILITVFSFVGAYLVFFLAEASAVGLKVSGILAVVVLGLYLGGTLRPRLDPHDMHTLHSIWHFLQFMMETLLFLLTGCFIGVFFTQSTILFTASDVGKMIGFNFLLLMIRYLVLALAWVFLNLVGYKVTWKEYILMGWSGLRGAIGLAIALLVSLNTEYSKWFREITILYIGGVIIFTVLIQGMTLKFIIKGIGYNRINNTKKKLWRDLRRRLFLNLLEKTESLRANRRITFEVEWQSIYRIFEFPFHIMNLDNLETGGKPLIPGYHYESREDDIFCDNKEKLDFLVSDDEVQDIFKEKKGRGKRAIYRRIEVREVSNNENNFGIKIDGVKDYESKEDANEENFKTTERNDVEDSKYFF